METSTAQVACEAFNLALDRDCYSRRDSTSQYHSTTPYNHVVPNYLKRCREDDEVNDQQPLKLVCGAEEAVSNGCETDNYTHGQANSDENDASDDEEVNVKDFETNGDDEKVDVDVEEESEIMVKEEDQPYVFVIEGIINEKEYNEDVEYDPPHFLISEDINTTSTDLSLDGYINLCDESNDGVDDDIVVVTDSDDEENHISITDDNSDAIDLYTHSKVAETTPKSSRRIDLPRRITLD